MKYYKAQKTLNNRSKKKLDHNTYLFYNQDHDYFYIQLHGNTIIRIYQYESHLFHCNWMTQTTKDRLNKYSGYNIYQKKGEWFFSHNDKPFYNGIVCVNSFDSV